MESGSRGEEGATAGRSILVVDDDPNVRALMKLALKRDGFKVTAVSDAPDALTLVNCGLHIDLLVTDFRMPGTNGVELYQQLTSEHGEVPVLFVTGTAFDLEASLSQLDAYSVLEKPFGIPQLLAAVRSLLMLPIPEALARSLNPFLH